MGERGSGLGVLALIGAAAFALASRDSKRVSGGGQSVVLTGAFVLSSPRGVASFQQGVPLRNSIAAMRSITAGGISFEELAVKFVGKIANTGTLPIRLRYTLDVLSGTQALRTTSDSLTVQVGETADIAPQASVFASDPAGGVTAAMTLYNGTTEERVAQKFSTALGSIQQVMSTELIAAGSYAYVVDQDQWTATGQVINKGNVALPHMNILANLLMADGSVSSGGVAQFSFGGTSLAQQATAGFRLTLVRPGHWSGQIPAGEVKIRLRVVADGLATITRDVGTGYVSQPTLAATLTGDFMVG